MKRIACDVVNGVKLRLFKEGPDDGAGKRPPVIDGEAVVLKGPSARAAGTCSPAIGEPCINLVSDEWWDKWVAQNRGVNPLLDLGHVRDIDAGNEEGATR